MKAPTKNLVWFCDGPAAFQIVRSLIFSVFFERRVGGWAEYSDHAVKSGGRHKSIHTTLRGLSWR